MLDELDWTSLEARKEQSYLAFFYKVHSGTVSLKKDKYLTPASNIMITSPCNEHPLTPHFYIEKVGFTRVYIIFLFLL